MNKAIIIGNLGRDPEVRYTQSGTCVANFSVATTYKPKNGEAVTEWHNIVVWDKLAEVCQKYLTKGSKAMFEGRLQTRKWQDKDGNDKYTTEIIVEKMEMLGSASGEQPKEQQSSTSNQPQQAETLDDEIPF